jgi:hypothetical protein
MLYLPNPSDLANFAVNLAFLELFYTFAPFLNKAVYAEKDQNRSYYFRSAM